VPRLHHVNLAVPPGAADAEGEFLEVLGYRRMSVPAGFEGRARWFEADDGSQVHLSVDPDHRASAMAHTAIELDGEADSVIARLDRAGIEHKTIEFDGRTLTFCADPGGNRWELRH
jgi:catechol 2,3-dioxygenase-like lactoylglutathione lyase family enzyme